MKNLLLVLFIFFGMASLMSESMAVAVQHGPWFFALGTLVILAATVLVGCLDFSLTRTNRFGWLFMIVAGAFITIASLLHGDSFLKPIWGIAYAVVGVLNFLREGKDEQAHGHAAH